MARMFVIFLILQFIIINTSLLTTSLQSNTCPINDEIDKFQITSKEIYKIHTDGHTEYIYEIPVYDNILELKGIILFVHGCDHSATDWWKKSKSCPLCIGLPEERKLIKYFVKHKFIVIAISSQNRETKCWSFNNDIPKIYEILLKFKSTQSILNNINLPLFAFGTSSGGALVGYMAMDKRFIHKNINLKGVVIQVSSLPVNDKNINKRLNVPILFIPMKKHKYGVIINQKQMNIINTNNNNNNIFAEIEIIASLQIDESFFYQQIEDDTKYNKEISKQIYNLLKNNAYLNQNNYLIEDVTKNKKLRKQISDIGNKLNDSLTDNTSPIIQQLQIAWALHAISSQKKEYMLSFFDKCVN